MFWNYRGKTRDLIWKQPLPMKVLQTVNTLKHGLFPRLDILAFSHRKQEEIKHGKTSMDTWFFFPQRSAYFEVLKALVCIISDKNPLTFTF